MEAPPVQNAGFEDGCERNQRSQRVPIRRFSLSETAPLPAPLPRTPVAENAKTTQRQLLPNRSAQNTSMLAPVVGCVSKTDAR
jgi:hypothetical protein